MIRSAIPLALAASLLGPASSAAESPFQLGIALRTGYTPVAQDRLNASMLGLGCSGDYALSSTFSLRGELAYFYVPGRSGRTDILPAASGKPQADPARSADVRKNALQGVVLRASGIYSLQGGWSLVGGLQAGQSRFTQEYVGNTIDAARTYQDTYNGVSTKSALGVSPFAGVQFEVDRDSSVELNAIGLAYTAVDFQHTPGSPLVSGDTTRPGSHLVYAGDHLEERSRMRLAIELSYRFRF